MNWTGTLLFLIAFTAIRPTIAEDSEHSDEPEAISTPNEANNEDQLTGGQAQLDSRLRSALLRALTDLENEDANETDAIETFEDSDKEIEKAHASSITIFANDLLGPATKNNDERQDEEPAKETQSVEEDPSPQKAQFVLFQQSEALPSKSITSLEETSIDPIKDAEHIITSASSNFDPRGLDTTSEPQSKESILQREQREFLKVGGFKNLNAISSSESKKPSKAIVVEKFSIGKDVEEPYIKTYVKPLGNDGVTYVKPVKNIESNEITKDQEVVTQKPVEVSTEESEAKVEQVQFFTAPLVAAFTVHQDETGQPKKVEPIFKNSIPSKETLQQASSQNFELQQKRQHLEQELENLRKQQQLLARSNFNNPDASNNQLGINQAISQNFNHFDPVFTEPDRSVVTKLATIDPNQLLNDGNGPFLNKFTASEAIVPLALSRQNPITNPPEQKPVANVKTNGDISLVPSISFDPLVEAGKLPENAKVLPNKEPTGFHNYVKLPNPVKQNNFLVSNTPAASFNLIGSNLNRVPINQNVIQPNLGVIQPILTQDFRTNTQLGRQEVNFQNQNRLLRQEQGTGNLGFRQNTFSIVPAQQPFPAKHELSLFPDNNRFLRQNEVNLLQPPATQNFLSPVQNNNRFLRPNNQNRFFRGSLESTPQTFNIQQSIQPFGIQPQNNRFFRSNFNQEGLLNNLQNVGFSQSQNNRFLRSNQESTFTQNGFVQRPVLQTYKYSNSFGFPNIPLH